MTDEIIEEAEVPVEAPCEECVAPIETPAE